MSASTSSVAVSADRAAEPADLADVASHLLRIAHPDADELEARGGSTISAITILPTNPGAPHHDPLGHLPPFSLR